VDEQLRRRAEVLRRAAIVLAAVAGAGLGVLIALVWRLVADGDPATAVLATVLSVLLMTTTAFSLLQVRAVTSLLDRHRSSPGGLAADLDRRLLALESELRRRDDVAREAAVEAAAESHAPD
jgi:hypothetical protein